MLSAADDQWKSIDIVRKYMEAKFSSLLEK